MRSRDCLSASPRPVSIPCLKQAEQPKVKLTFENIVYEVKIMCSKEERESTGKNFIT